MDNSNKINGIHNIAVTATAATDMSTPKKYVKAITNKDLSAVKNHA